MLFRAPAPKAGVYANFTTPAQPNDPTAPARLVTTRPSALRTPPRGTVKECPQSRPGGVAAGPR